MMFRQRSALTGALEEHQGERWFRVGSWCPLWVSLMFCWLCQESVDSNAVTYQVKKQWKKKKKKKTMEFYLSHTEDYKLGSSENSSGWRSWKNSHIHFQDKGSYIKMWCWRRHWRVFWTAGWSNQSLLMEIYPAQSLEGLMLKMKLLYSGHLMGRADSLGKPLVLGKFEGSRRREWQRLRLLDGIINSMDMSLSRLHEMGRG